MNKEHPWGKLYCCKCGSYTGGSLIGETHYENDCCGEPAHNKDWEKEYVALVEKLKLCLKYCQEQNGLPYCKNCGLDSSLLEEEKY